MPRLGIEGYPIAYAEAGPQHGAPPPLVHGTLPGQMHEGRRPCSRAPVQAPALLPGGAERPPQFGLSLDALEQAMPDARRVTIARAAHGLNHDNAEEFNRAVLDFLAAY